MRFRLPGDRVTGELTLRHWSNAGIRVGVPRADVMPLGPSFDLRIAAARGSQHGEALP